MNQRSSSTADTSAIAASLRLIEVLSTCLEETQSVLADYLGSHTPAKAKLQFKDVHRHLMREFGNWSGKSLLEEVDAGKDRFAEQFENLHQIMAELESLSAQKITSGPAGISGTDLELQRRALRQASQALISMSKQLAEMRRLAEASQSQARSDSTNTSSVAQGTEPFRAKPPE